MGLEFDESEVRKAIAIFHPDGQTFEVRLIHDKFNSIGIFNSADALVDALKEVWVEPGVIAYMTLNQLHEACYSRGHKDHFMQKVKNAVSDNDVTDYRWLLIDIDPKRPAGTASSNEELKASQELAARIRNYLRDTGWPEPVIAHSGNGTHLLYKVDLPAEMKPLMQAVLKTLNMLFGTEQTDIDLTTFNPSRVCKLYGTIARKGANTPDRPHRMSRILRVPDRIETVTPEQLKALADILPKPEKPQAYNGYNPGSFDLQKWIDDHGVRVTEKSSYAGGTRWILECCPFNPQHNHKDAAIFQGSDGKLGFHCFHTSCAGNTWREFRQFYEPDAYQERTVQPAVPNYMLTKPPDFGETHLALEGQEVKPEGPVWRTTEEIRTRVIPDEAHILTGIRGIDSRMIGLKKGYVSVLSGLRSAGKSSILSQIVVQCREQGLKCALFSGEMIDKQVLKWLTLQAAGKTHVVPTRYERVFYPDDTAAELVSKWLDGFVYVYNNDYGNRFKELEEHLIQVITEKQLDLVLLDNLMAIDIEDLDRDMYARQTKFVKELKRMAQNLNIHVLFVAHPRKSDGYLRMDDISGSGDLSNVADNVFIIHRVDEDYKSATQKFFQWKATNPIYQADNVIEICKDRDFGSRDVYVPLYFEVETKRLKNERAEYIHYGWEPAVRPEDRMQLVDEETPW